MTNGRARARLTTGGSLLVALVSLLSLAAFPRTARATPSARLVYSRAQSASSCPDEAALRKAVAARIGYDPFFGWAKKTVVVRMVPADGPGYVASVDLVDDQGYEHGARQIRTEGKCAELRDPVALAIAIALDPSILARGAAAPPPPSPETGEAQPTAAATTAGAHREPPPPAALAVPVPTAPLAQPGASVTSPPGSKPGPRWEPEVIAALVGSIGVAPAPAAGASLGFGVRHGQWSAALEGRFDFASGEPAPEGERVSSSLVVGTFAPCWMPGLVGLTGLVRMCALAQAGEFTASSSTSPNQSNPWLAFGGRLAVTVPFDALRLIRLRSDVLWDVDPPQLFLAGVPWAIWSAPAVAASFAIEGTVGF